MSDSNHGQQRPSPTLSPPHCPASTPSNAPMAHSARLAADPPLLVQSSQKSQMPPLSPASMPVPAYFGRAQRPPSSGQASGIPGPHHPYPPASMGMLAPPQRPSIIPQTHNMHSAVVATASSSSSNSGGSQPSVLRPLLHPPSPVQHRHSLSLSHMQRTQHSHSSAPAHHRPYEMHSPAPAARTFWNHYETGLLVQLWLELEPQFVANKRNAGVWAQLAQRLTEQSARYRTVRECRIKWKNMWAKHRDLVNAMHMSHDAKLREFPYFSDFSAIRQRSSMMFPRSATQQEASEERASPSDDGHQYFSPRATSHPYSPVPLSISSSSFGSAPVYSPPAPHLAMDDRWARPKHEAAATSQMSQASLASILSSDTRPNPTNTASTLQHLLSPAAAETQPSATHLPNPGSAERQSSIRDIAGLLHRLDRSPDSYDNDYDMDDSDSVGKACSVDGMIERMRALASESTAADVSSAVHQIMIYVERESRRRHVQSERHHRVVAALADILAQSTASSTAAPSAAASRRSSGFEREWSPRQHMSRHGLLLQNTTTIPRQPSCESTPTDSPPHSTR
ncbi:hypothetical protein GGI20_003355 [Coemansia sp. BCRC 34301]|nr:hypothetical protein GGI20_003355 [Coemansia sp. BCRC 34301]